MDVYIFRRATEGKLDCAYIEQEIEKLGLSDFLHTIEELAAVWFGNKVGQLSASAEEMAFYILSGSTYGSKDLYSVGTVREYMSKGKSLKSARRWYYLSMVFLPASQMARMYPVLKKAPFLLPVCWVCRWIRILVKTPANIVLQYRHVKQIQVFNDAQDKK